jgi:hypothetical protein
MLRCEVMRTVENFHTYLAPPLCKQPLRPLADAMGLQHLHLYKMPPSSTSYSPCNNDFLAVEDSSSRCGNCAPVLHSPPV